MCSEGVRNGLHIESKGKWAHESSCMGKTAMHPLGKLMPAASASDCMGMVVRG